MNLSRRSFLFMGAAAGTGAIIHSLIPKPVIFDMGGIRLATNVEQVAFKNIPNGFDEPGFGLSAQIDYSIDRVLRSYGAERMTYVNGLEVPVRLAYGDQAVQIHQRTGGLQRVRG